MSTDSTSQVGRSWQCWWAWVVLPALGAWWAGRLVARTYYFYDEWSMVDRAVRSNMFDAATTSFNGHLWLVQDVLYRVQVAVFGVDDHAFISVLFVAALVVLHLSLAWLLHRGGVPGVASPLVAGLLVYLGSASQNFLFAVQVSPISAAACGLLATAIAIGHSPSRRARFAVAVLLLACVAFDSGIALTGLTLAGIAVLMSWGRRHAAVLLPSGALAAAWYLWGDLGASSAAGPLTLLEFAGHLLLRSAGAIVGSGEVAGAMLLGAASGVVTVQWRAGRLVGPPRILLVAGSAATAVTIAALSHARAGMPGFNYVDLNRYLQNVALPLTVALAPAVAVACRAAAVRCSPAAAAKLTALPVVALMAAFALGLDEQRSYSQLFLSWNDAVHEHVQSASVVIRDGCPSGATPDAASAPARGLSPQLTVVLLQELMRRGLLHAPPSLTPRADTVEAICPSG